MGYLEHLEDSPGGCLADNFVKLYGSILDSSVWSEDAFTRLVWITMLAMADEDGIVRAATPGLARRSNIPIEACETALVVLSSPDKYSKSPEHDGRRVQAIDGGWVILNHRKYRDMRSRVQAQTASRVEKHRESALHGVTERYTALQSVTGPLHGVTDPPVTLEAEAEAEGEAKEETTTTELVLVSAQRSASPKPPVERLLPAQYVGVFNAVFSRDLKVSPKVVERIKERLREGYRPWQLIALPIMVDAQPTLAADMRKGLDLLMLLRDGRHQKTGADGKTWGATDWLEREIGRLDRTVLSPRLADIAKQANVLEQLMACGAAVRQAS